MFQELSGNIAGGQMQTCITSCVTYCSSACNYCSSDLPRLEVRIVEKTDLLSLLIESES